MNLVEEASLDIQKRIYPFWSKLVDQKHGGFIGKVDFDLQPIPRAHKGVILNSRILYFFSEYAIQFASQESRSLANHAYMFLRDNCLDKTNGGLYWSLLANGEPFDTTKHAYNQAFGIYALSTYYRLSQKQEALDIALNLFDLLESKYREAKEPHYYIEAMDKDFNVLPNDKLSENGVIAERTMNTALHLLEAYAALYKVAPVSKVKRALEELINLFTKKIYNPTKKRLEVFFDKDYNSLLDLESYGHDIEASWLLSEACHTLDDKKLIKEVDPITLALVDEAMKQGFRYPFLIKEKEGKHNDGTRVWWIQAEAINGLINAYEIDHNPQRLEDAKTIYKGIIGYFHDKRPGGCWFWDLNAHNLPSSKRCIVEPWKCPYHNGRMCLMILRRLGK
jgi:mannobiose 2-epimerase